jgi:psp operon transcriptional activator
VIEYQEFERIGGTQTLKVDVRVVAATNADLPQEIAAGRFRADLYDRLRFSVIRLPPLRERPEDIAPLVEFFATQLCREVPSIILRPFSRAALAALEAHPWPGNVRELKFAVERALCVASGREVGIADLPPEVQGHLPRAADQGGFDEQLATLEAGLLRRALEQAGGSQKQAAQGLGLTYDRFRHLLRRHDLIGR